MLVAVNGADRGPGRAARETLRELAHGLEDAGDGEARYGLLVSLYQPRQAGLPDPGAPPDPRDPANPANPGDPAARRPE